MNNKKLLNIQYLRGIAAFMVCGFHTKGWLDNTITSNFGEMLFPSGEYGVQFFFVISGFIMVYTTQNLNIENPFKSIVSFLKKRIIRISPLYTVLTLAWFFLFIYPLYSINYVSCIKIIKSLLFIPFGNFPILYLGWTLNFEMFFYLVFALCFFFKKYRYWALCLFFVIQITLHHLSFDHSYMKLIANPIISYFFVGVLIGLILNSFKIFAVHRYLRILGFIILLLIQLELFKVPNFYLQMIIIGICCFLIFAYDLQAEDKVIKPLYFLGNISFSLYLFHPFVHKFLMEYLNLKPGFLENPVYNLLFYIFMLSIIFGFSYLLHQFFEKKIIQYLRF